MISGMLVRLDRWWRLVLPSLVGLAFLLVMALPTPVPHLARIEPNLLLAAAYFWAVHRPDAMSPLAAFLIGLVADLITRAPPGCHALVLVPAIVMVRSQRRLLAGRAFALLWTGFLPVALVGAAIESLVALVATLALPPVADQFTRALMSFAVFPPVAWLLLQVHHWVEQPE